ncbi:MAG TPA: hypothetical protein VFF06_23570 [Polyangia bacterium]|nr:hypothetical protein [Polyangia bacterium]
MLIGHYAPAFALQRARPSLPLWVLFIAVQAVDVLWGVFVLAGVEHVRIVPGFSESNALDLYYMPYSHSLAATVVWALVFGLAWTAFRGWREGVVIGVAVASHFVTDLLVHLPDLPIAAGNGPKIGLGLWRWRWLALAVEAGLFVGAALWWWRARGGSRFLVLIGVMTVVLVASFFVPTPPTPQAMAATGLGTYALLAGAAAWNERARSRSQAPFRA